MNNLYFTALAIALIYYFFYLPSPKKSNANLPPQQNKAVQTEREIAEKETQTETDELNKTELIQSLKADIQQKERTIIGLNNSYERLETKKDEQIRSLKADKQKLLEQINFFTKNKELIKEAVVFHLNQASSFTTTNAYPYFLERVRAQDYQEVPELATLSVEERENLDPEKRNFIISRAYDRQMTQNEKIVKECKELLKKLERV